MIGIMKRTIQWGGLKFLISLTILTATNAQSQKAGNSVANKNPILLDIYGLHNDEARSNCLKRLNRERVRPIQFSEKKDPEFKIHFDRRNRGYQVRLDKAGNTLKTIRVLYEYEACAAAASLVNELIPDE